MYTCNFTYNFKGVRNSGLKTHSLQDGFNGMLFPVRDVYVILVNKYMINAEERLTREQYDGFALPALKLP